MARTRKNFKNCETEIKGEACSRLQRFSQLDGIHQQKSQIIFLKVFDKKVILRSREPLSFSEKTS
jgi:hypothetical protein